MEKLSYVRKESDLEKQIALAERVGRENLSDYERMRLNNMKERQGLLEQLDFDTEKKAIADARKEMMIFQPKEAPSLRAPSSRIKAKKEKTDLVGDNKSVSVSAMKNWSAPRWVGQWVPKKKGVQGGANFQHIYDLDKVSSENHVPKMDLKVKEVIEHAKDYHKSVSHLDSLTAEVRDLEVEGRYTDLSFSLDNMVVTRDSVVTTSELTSVDTCCTVG